MKDVIGFVIASILIGVILFLLAESKSAGLVGGLVTFFSLNIYDGIDKIMEELKKRDRD